MAAKGTGKGAAREAVRLRGKATATPPAKLTRKAYEKELRRLQTELCLVQDWVRATGQGIVIIFEGRDAAGKGGTIRAITERCSPRIFRIVALPTPSDREKTQMHIQRYLPHFPAAGEVVIFDRSYYNRRESRRCWDSVPRSSTANSSTSARPSRRSWSTTASG
jgi:polyphosphate kinase 2 (PPK2 family)